MRQAITTIPGPLRKTLVGFIGRDGARAVLNRLRPPDTLMTAPRLGAMKATRLSFANILARYSDIDDSFPVELRDVALPYFVDWLIESVHLVEITAYSDGDAYTIFETMNDRGLSLTPADMLKGYLLANITDPDGRACR